MTRQKKYKEPMSLLSVRIKTAHKDILQGNTEGDNTITKMVSIAIERYIIQEGLNKCQ